MIAVKLCSNPSHLASSFALTAVRYFEEVLDVERASLKRVARLGTSNAFA